MTTAEILWITIPIVVLFFALFSGIPLWMTIRRPDRHPRETRTVPAYLRQRPSAGLAAQRPAPARDDARERELAWANRSR